MATSHRAVAINSRRDESPKLREIVHVQVKRDGVIFRYCDERAFRARVNGRECIVKTYKDPLNATYEIRWIKACLSRGLSVPAIFEGVQFSAQAAQRFLTPHQKNREPICAAVAIQAFDYTLLDALDKLAVPVEQRSAASRHAEAYMESGNGDDEDLELLTDGFILYQILEKVLQVVLTLDVWDASRAFRHGEVRPRNVVFSVLQDGLVSAAMIDFENVHEISPPGTLAGVRSDDILGDLFGDLFECARRWRTVDKTRIAPWMHDLDRMNRVIDMVTFFLDVQRGFAPEDPLDIESIRQ